MFEELSTYEALDISGGDWGDIFEKINPLDALDWIYERGVDFGAASVKFGRECYGFYRDVKTIFN